jgi:hypothetical protein
VVAARGEVEGERAWVEDRRAEIDAIRTQAQQEVWTHSLSSLSFHLRPVVFVLSSEAKAKGVVSERSFIQSVWMSFFQPLKCLDFNS